MYKWVTRWRECQAAKMVDASGDPERAGRRGALAGKVRLDRGVEKVYNVWRDKHRGKLWPRI